ncbi:10941_t:CDS:2, partial [Gigaspora margarita]
KAKVNLDETNIILDNDFNEEVKVAVVNNHQCNEKIRELKRISKKYGHIYASEVVFGGAIIEKYKNIRTQANDSTCFGIETVGDFELIHTEGGYESNYTTTRTIDISNEELTIIGGDEILFVNNDPEAIRLWRSLFNNSKYWKIISYKIQPIFDLLDSDLKNQVLKAFGEQILKVGTITHYAKLLSSNLTPIVIDDWSNGKLEDVTSNPLQCQIFASIMNKDNCIYSLQTESIDKDTPAFVVHYIGRRKKPKKIIDCKIHIGWIIVGYPESPLESSNYDIYDSKMVTGIHFSSKNSACMFFHSLDNCHNVDNNINEISPSNIIFNMIDIKNNESCMLDVEWKNKNPHYFLTYPKN